MLVEAFLLPHGSRTLDPRGDKTTENINAALQTVAARIHDQLKPDIILLSTPHGVSLSDSFGVYLNSCGKGTAEWKGEHQKFEIQNLKMNLEISKDFLEHLKKQRVNAQGITMFSGAEPCCLRWGEVVPLYHIHQRYEKELSKQGTHGAKSAGSPASTGGEKQSSTSPSYVIISHPRRMLSLGFEELTAELQQMGDAICSFCNRGKYKDKKIVLVVSGDLAHTHSKSKEAPYLFSETADVFDNLIEKWVCSLETEYLQKAQMIVHQALSCGFTGILLLDAVMKSEECDCKMQTTPTILCSQCHPTYYGMMVASFSLSPHEDSILL